jgi:hypothetical protein
MVKLLDKKQLETMCILLKTTKKNKATDAAHDFWKNSKCNRIHSKNFSQSSTACLNTKFLAHDNILLG